MQGTALHREGGGGGVGGIARQSGGGKRKPQRRNELLWHQIPAPVSNSDAILKHGAAHWPHTYIHTCALSSAIRPTKCLLIIAKSSTTS